MKYLLPLSLLLLVPFTPSCETVRAVASVPAAVVSDVGDALPGEPAPTLGDVVVDSGAQAAGTGVTIATGDAALGGAVTAALMALGAFALRKKKPTTTP